jgi:hypothetical protein
MLLHIHVTYNIFGYANFQVLALVLLKTPAFCDVTLSQFLQNVGSYSSSNTASHHRRMESSFLALYTHGSKTGLQVHDLKISF